MNLVFCTPDFSLLPPHIITRVLRYLKCADYKNASSVCKAWHYASTDPQIVRTLILEPKEENFPEICKSNRRFGVLILNNLKFNKMASHYFELFEIFCPFVYELHIIGSDLKIHHLIKLLELTVRLEVVSFVRCFRLRPWLFPLHYECEAKSRIAKNLSGVKSVVIVNFRNIPLITDIVKYTTNLESFRISNRVSNLDRHYDNPYKEVFKIFENYNVRGLKHLNLSFDFYVNVDDFITKFVKLENLNLRSFTISLFWKWESGVYKSSLFLQFILKLQSLVEFSIDRLREDQLSLICQHLVNLKSLNCRLYDNDQPISELANLKQLEILRCRFLPKCGTYRRLDEIDKLFKCKFDNLIVFNFEAAITEPNLLQLCVNHPNLIELKLTCLLTRNLEIIFKYLTKLRVLKIYFGRASLTDSVNHLSSVDSNLQFEYEYKISRLHNLEKFYLDELVNGISEYDVRQLKKLRSTNLPQLFSKQVQ